MRSVSSGWLKGGKCLETRLSWISGQESRFISTKMMILDDHQWLKSNCFQRSDNNCKPFWLPQELQWQVERKWRIVIWLHIWPLYTWRCLLSHYWQLCWRLKCMMQQMCPERHLPFCQGLSVSSSGCLLFDLNKLAGSW